MNNLMTITVRPLLLAALCLAHIAAAHHASADQIDVGLPYPQVTVTDAHDGLVAFTFQSGQKSTALAGEVRRVRITGWDSLNLAEDLLSQNKPADAADQFRKTFTQTPPGWRKRLAAYRLISAQAAADLMDRAVAGWLAVVADEGPSPGTLSLCPATSGTPSPTDDQAITILQDAISTTQDPSMVISARRLLVTLLKRQDRIEEAQTQASLAPPQPVVTLNVMITSPTLRKIADLLAQGRPDQAADQLDAQWSSLPASQLPAALIIRGLARMHLADQAADPAARKALLLDAGLDFMTVPADFDDYPAAAAEALYQAGQLNLKLTPPNNPAAQAAFAQAVKLYPDELGGRKSADALAKLKDNQNPKD